tara:strand:+ start:2040 stop:2444 length:405 start_codon:yes stop_codon:yes gene_type:complete
MPRKSQFTNEYKKEHGKNPIPFPYIVLDAKKEVYFRIVSGFPATWAIKPIMREHFPDDYKGIIASDKTWRELMKNLPPHFVIQKDKKVVFLIKGIFPEEIILDKYINNFPKGYKGILVRCEESFYKMRMRENKI